jgi:hypothetical protein
MGNEFFKTKFDTAERACNEVASFSLLWYDAEKSDFHEPKHGKRKKRDCIMEKRSALRRFTDK